jgi:hypothetical protein
VHYLHNIIDVYTLFLISIWFELLQCVFCLFIVICYIVRVVYVILNSVPSVKNLDPSIYYVYWIVLRQRIYYTCYAWWCYAYKKMTNQLFALLLRTVYFNSMRNMLQDSPYELYIVPIVIVRFVNNITACGIRINKKLVRIV